jgi:hypothetical protein
MDFLGGAVVETGLQQFLPPVVVEAPPNGNLDSLLASLERERIAELAYSYWEQRGCPLGSAEEDWFRAERTIRERD